MTAQTQAQRNASYRARQRAKIERYEAALREIAGDQHDATGCNPQIMRNIAREALNPPALHIET